MQCANWRKRTLADLAQTPAQQAMDRLRTVLSARNAHHAESARFSLKQPSWRDDKVPATENSTERSRPHEEGGA
jgi:hypothetical protein